MQLSFVYSFNNYSLPLATQLNVQAEIYLKQHKLNLRGKKKMYVVHTWFQLQTTEVNFE